MKSPLLLTPLFFISIAGLVASLVVHARTFFGHPFAGLVLPVVVMLALTVLAILAGRPEHQTGLRMKLSDAFRGGPAWAAPATYVFMAYAVVNFVIAFVNTPASGKLDAVHEARLLSGHAMLFFAADAGTFLSALHRHEETAWRP